jgi:hypothetical protein
MKKMLIAIIGLSLLLFGCSNAATQNASSSNNEPTNDIQPTSEPETEEQKIIELIPGKDYKRGQKVKVVGIVKTEPTKSSNFIDFQLLSYGQIVYITVSADLECDINIDDAIEVQGIHNGSTKIKAYDTQKEVDVIEIYVKNDIKTLTELPSQESIPTEAPTEKPTEPITEPPTEKPTEKPTEPPTPAPTQPPTNPPTEKPTPAPTQPPTEPPTQKPTQKPVSASNIQVLEEYTYSYGAWLTVHLVVIKNNNDKPVEISTSTLAYKSDGTLISVSNGTVDVVGSGCVTIYSEIFETEEEISYYDTELNVELEDWYECGLNDLSYTQTPVKDGAIFQVTNNGSKPIDFVQGYALFFKDNTLIGWSSEYFTDNDYNIKPGKTISKQISVYNEYDTVKFYLTGRIDKW